MRVGKVRDPSNAAHALMADHNTDLTARLNPRQFKAFAFAQQAAARVMKRRLRLFRLIRRGYTKLSRHEASIGQVKDDLHTLLRLARSWTKREYRNIPWRSVLFAVTAIVYFVNPADLLPDALAGIGFVDDAAVIGAVVKAIRRDLDAFKRWESAHLSENNQRLLPE